MPWVRCQPYIIAIAIGYVLNYTKDRKIVINKVGKIVHSQLQNAIFSGWLLAAGF